MIRRALSVLTYHVKKRKFLHRDPARARVRAARLHRGRMLLREGDLPPLGDHLHRSRLPRAAPHAAPPDAALRSGGRVRHFRLPLPRAGPVQDAGDGLLDDADPVRRGAVVLRDLPGRPPRLPRPLLRVAGRLGRPDRLRGRLHPPRPLESRHLRPITLYTRSTKGCAASEDGGTPGSLFRPGVGRPPSCGDSARSLGCVRLPCYLPDTLPYV